MDSDEAVHPRELLRISHELYDKQVLDLPCFRLAQDGQKKLIKVAQRLLQDKIQASPENFQRTVRAPRRKQIKPERNVRDVDGNGEASLPDLTVLALYHGQHYLVPDYCNENYI